jgi:hypothetical protein
MTNAIRHVKWPSDVPKLIGLNVSVHGPYFVVIVTDPDPTLPVVREPVEWDSYDWSSDKAENNGAPICGMGLVMVTTMCAEMGGIFDFAQSEPWCPGKLVFFALPYKSYDEVSHG